MLSEAAELIICLLYLSSRTAEICLFLDFMNDRRASCHSQNDISLLWAGYGDKTRLGNRPERIYMEDICI